MDLTRKYLLSNVYRSPDEPTGALVVEPVVPAPDAGDPGAADPAATVVDPAAEQDAPAGADHGNKGKKPWFLDRISETTARATAAEQRASAAERRAQEAEALATRLQNGGNPPPPAAAVQEQQPQNLDQLVTARAAQMRLAEDSVAIRDAGLAAFGSSFNENLAILTAVGATSDDVVLDLIAVDKQNAHKLLAELAKDPERAAALVGMDSRRRIAELTRMSAAPALAAEAKPATPAPAAPAARTTSRAPAPPPAVTPSASKTVDWRSDEASDADFDVGFQDMLKKRAARR